MRKTIKLLGIAAIIAVIGFTMAACGDDIPTIGGGPHTHSWGDWRSNTTQHWKECSCGEEYGRASHEFSGNICSVCNYNSSTGEQGTNPTVTTTSLPNGTVGTAYSQTLTAAGATPITWSIDTGSLPGGLTLSTAGVISGTPTTANTFNFTVKATNATGSGTKSLSIIIVGGGINPSITIENRTGVSISEIRVKPPMQPFYSANRLTSSYLANGASFTFTLADPLSEISVYDIQLTNSNTTFRKWDVTVTNGMTITVYDYEISTGNEFQKVVILNRTGYTLGTVKVRASGTTAYGTATGTILNNNDGVEFTIPIRRSLTTTFDFQVQSANTSQTYTRNNVNFASNNMGIMFTTAHADGTPPGNPIIVIENNTGESLPQLYVRKSGTTSWGTDLSPYTMSNGKSCTVTLPESLSANNVYDIALFWPGFGTTYIKENVTVTEGMVVTFTSADKR
jgi:hypothetical protein